MSLSSAPWAHRGAAAALLAVAAGAGAAVRAATWPWVYAGGEVRIVGDGDVLYHLLQARRLLAEGLGAVWHDPGLNFPVGADVPWPPLFDALLAGAGWVAAGGAEPDAATLLAAAVWVPLLLGVATVVLVAWLGQALLGGRPWLEAALVLALLPSHALMTALGRADQHALEPLLLALLLLAAARLARGGGRGAAALLGVAAALAFWNWNGSALYLALLAGFAAAWHALAPAGEEAPGRAARGLAAGLLGGALLLAGSVALLGPAAGLSAARLSGLSGLQPALVAGAALACGVLAAARRWRPAAAAPERAATAGAALLLPPALLLALPWTGEALWRGLAMLSARGWYRTIVEFRPLLPSGLSSVAEDVERVLAFHGLTPLAVVAALALAGRRFRRGEAAGRGPALLFGVAAAGLLVLGWARNRFGVYLALAEALATALVAREAAAAAASRWPARRLAGPAAGVAVAALLVAPVLPWLPEADWAPVIPGVYEDLVPLAGLAGQHPRQPGREAVFAPWSHGHELRYWSGRPVVSSPFGVEGGEGALEADAAFHFTSDQAAAEALLAERQVGLVLITAPLEETISLEAFAPPGTPELTRREPGASIADGVEVLPAFRGLVAVRLWLWDGMPGEVDALPPGEGAAPIDGFRLVAESRAEVGWSGLSTPIHKLFEPVAGARLAVLGEPPGARVEASTVLRTNRGREVAWSTHAAAGADGVAVLRLPYATGFNGVVRASPWRITGGRSGGAVETSERAVLAGERLEVWLGR